MTTNATRGRAVTDIEAPEAQADPTEGDAILSILRTAFDESAELRKADTDQVVARGRVEMMAEHVQALCGEHGVQAEYVEKLTCASADRTSRCIRIRPVRSSKTYAEALHELGHVLGRNQSAPRLISEGAAWRWALDNARRGLANDAFRNKARASLLSYLAWAAHHQYRKVPPVIPAGGVFWEVMAEVGYDMTAQEWAATSGYTPSPSLREGTP
jgi:hypothetical protein